MSAGFASRIARDSCNYKLTWLQSGSSVTGVELTADGNTCAEPIPVTFPNNNRPDRLPAGARTEQRGNDPFTVWVSLSGQAISMNLATPISW